MVPQLNQTLLLPSNYAQLKAYTNQTKLFISLILFWGSRVVTSSKI